MNIYLVNEESGSLYNSFIYLIERNVIVFVNKVLKEVGGGC